ncbi:MAG: hypothetical protein WBD46_05265 [Acidobacteriaceae bacterium]
MLPISRCGCTSWTATAFGIITAFGKDMPVGLDGGAKEPAADPGTTTKPGTTN